MMDGWKDGRMEEVERLLKWTAVDCEMKWTIIVDWTVDRNITWAGVYLRPEWARVECKLEWTVDSALEWSGL